MKPISSPNSEHRSVVTLSALALSFLLSSCGGSSDGESGEQNPVSDDPVVDGEDIASEACSEISVSFENTGAESISAETADQIFAIPLSWENITGSFSSTPYGQNGYPDATDDSGVRLFTGGSDVQSVGEQIVTVAPSDIGCSFRLGADIGGFASQDDNAVVTFSFLSSNNEEIENFILGPVTKEDRENQTLLLLRTVEGIVPDSAVQARLVITHNRLQGSANDGYVDNITLTVRQ